MRITVRRRVGAARDRNIRGISSALSVPRPRPRPEEEEEAVTAGAWLLFSARARRIRQNGDRPPAVVRSPALITDFKFDVRLSTIDDDVIRRRDERQPQRPVPPSTSEEGGQGQQCAFAYVLGWMGSLQVRPRMLCGERGWVVRRWSLQRALGRRRQQHSMGAEMSGLFA